MKTLGQIAMDAWDKADADGLTTSDELFAVAAQAVREAVIEECAKVCEDTFIDYINGDDDSSGFSIYGDKCAKELRQMIKKDKK